VEGRTYEGGVLAGHYGTYFTISAKTKLYIEETNSQIKKMLRNLHSAAIQFP